MLQNCVKRHHVSSIQVYWWLSTSLRNVASVTWTLSTWMGPLCAASPSSTSCSRCHLTGCIWCMWWCSSVGHTPFCYVRSSHPTQETGLKAYTPCLPRLGKESPPSSGSGCSHFIGDCPCGVLSKNPEDMSTYTRPAIFHVYLLST